MTLKLINYRFNNGDSGDNDHDDNVPNNNYLKSLFLP
jgi:hypothetical protein